MKLSASLIKSFMKCPTQAYFNIVERVPQRQHAAASFGSAVHLALELYNNTKDVEAAVHCFLFAWDHPEEFDIEPQIWAPRTSFGAYRQKGIEIIRTYHENHQWVKREIIGTEVRFMVDFGDHQLSGMVDLLETPTDSTLLKVTDFKSGYRPSANNLHLDIQFTTYMYAVQQKEFWCGHPDEPDKYCGLENGEELFERFKSYDIEGYWYDLKKNKEYNVGPRTERDFARLLRCCDQIARAVELDVFVPDISGETCGVCSYNEICPVYLSPTSPTEK